MKKFTLIASALLAFCSLAANAGDKVFYKVKVADAETWTRHGDIAVAAGNVKNTSGSGGRAYFTTFANPYANVTLPETGYTLSTVFTLGGVGDARKNDFEIAFLNEAVTPTTTWTTYGENENAIFTLTQSYRPDATAEGTAGTRAVACVLNGVRSADAAAPTPAEIALANIVIAAGTKYKLDINVVGQTVNWSLATVADDVATPYKNGQYDLPAGVSNKITSFYGILSRANSNITYESMNLSYHVEGEVAQEPSLDLFYVQGAERDYFVDFKEGEILHWIQLGDADDVNGNPYTDGQEYTVAYNDAMDTRTFDPGEEGGHKIIYCNASGQLKVWTTREEDENNKSDEVVADVVCEAIQLPAPVAKITNVKAGFEKEYTLSVDNSDVLLKPTITIHYKLTQGSDVRQGDVLSGEKIKFTGVGTLELYSTDKGAKTPRYTNSETSIIANDVEYEEALVKDFVWTKEKCDGDVEGFTKLEIIDNANKSHWDRIYSNQTYGYDKDNVIVNNDGTYADGKSKADVVQEKAGFGFYDRSKIGTTDAKWNVQVPLAENLRDAFFPLIPAAEDYSKYAENAWSIFPCEGIVYYSTDKAGLNSANCVELNIAPYFVSDNASKPNFYIVTKRGGYDRPDKGNCESTDVVVAGEKFNLYRYDSAIREVRVLVYKGFDWTTSIAAPSCVLADDADAPIYTLSGVQVKDATAPGIYIQNGKKFIVK